VAREDAKQQNDAPLPAGAVARLGTTRFRPGEGTQAVSFLPDKRTLVVTKEDGRLQHWDAATGRFLRDHRFSNEEVSAAAITPDGRHIAARGMYWAALYDAQRGQEKLRHKLADNIRGELIAVSDDASVIVVGGSVRPIHHVIDLASGAAVDWPMNMETGALALSPDGNLLAAAAPGLVRVWKWRESREPRYFTIAHKNIVRKADIRSLRFSPDASLLAVGIDAEAASLLDLATGKEVGRLAMEGDDGGSWREMVFSPDGRLLATPTSSINEGGVSVWEVASGKMIQRLKTPSGGTSSIAFSPDGKWLTGTSLILCVWNVETGELLGRDLARHMAPPSAMQFFAGDERLATVGHDRIHLWNLETAEAERVMRHDRKPNEYARSIRAMDVSPNEKYVASSCMADTVRIWEVDTARELHRLPGHGRLGNRRSVRFTPDSQRLLSWGDDMYVRVWDVRTGKKLQEYEAKPVAAQIDDRRKKFGVESALGSQLGLRAGVFSQDATRLVIGLKAMHVFDVGSGRELLRFDYPKTSILWHLAVSSDNAYALLVGFGYEYEESPTGGEPVRKTIHRAELRQLSDGKLIGELDREDGGESAAAFSPDSRRAAITVGKDHPRVVIVKIPEMTEVGQIDGFRESPRALEFSHSGKLLAVSSGDTSVVVYDLAKLPTRQ
jgi:WD40 repeat protein